MSLLSSVEGIVTSHKSRFTISPHLCQHETSRTQLIYLVSREIGNSLLRNSMLSMVQFYVVMSLPGRLKKLMPLPAGVLGWGIFSALSLVFLLLLVLTQYVVCVQKEIIQSCRTAAQHAR